MAESRNIMSPPCQLPKKALTALEQASVDELLEPGAFTAMGHLPAAGVLHDALEYAQRLVESIGAKDLETAREAGVLPGAQLMPADASFLSQVTALGELARHHEVAPEQDGEGGVELSVIVEDARTRLVERIASWREEPGRRSPRLRVQVGETGALWPQYVLGDGTKDTLGDPDAFALFVALPLLAPFLVLEEDCFVAPRLE